MKNKISITITVVALVALVFFYLATSAGSGVKGEKESGTGFFGVVPQFSLKNYEGEIVSTADFTGKIMVINSWAVWCPFCKDELVDFSRLQDEYKDDVAVIAIDRAERLEKAKEFTDSVGITDKMIFLMDPKDSFYRDIGGFSMPETIFVDRDGNIIFHKRGPMELIEMEEKIESII